LQLFDSEHPDLVTLDLGLPKVSGFRLIEVFKRSTPPGPVPVIVVTAMSFEEGEYVAHAGADAFITKPLAPEDLVSRVAFTLARRPA
jgi:two-component system sensor histidine kinase/response regulator